jgi:hypothetical protein
MERLPVRVHTIHASTGEKAYRALRGIVKKEA